MEVLTVASRPPVSYTHLDVYKRQGTYTITSTDNNSCTATTVLTVNQPMLGVNISNITNILCFGDCNATAQANNIGGVNPITYSITAVSYTHLDVYKRQVYRSSYFKFDLQFLAFLGCFML